MFLRNLRLLIVFVKRLITNDRKLVDHRNFEIFRNFKTNFPNLNIQQVFWTISVSI